MADMGHRGRLGPLHWTPHPEWGQRQEGVGGMQSKGVTQPMHVIPEKRQQPSADHVCGIHLLGIFATFGPHPLAPSACAVLLWKQG